MTGLDDVATAAPNGGPVADLDREARKFAAYYFDQNVVPGDTTTRFPSTMGDADRARYHRDAAAHPQMVRLLTVLHARAAVCDSCGHDQAEELRWLGKNGDTVLCRSLPDCQRRRVRTEGQP